MPYKNNNYNNKPKFKERKPLYDPDEPFTDEIKNKLIKRGENYCLWLLGKSDKTKKELSDKLRLKGYPDEVIEVVIQKIINDGYVNDENYTENFVRSRTTYRKQGRNAISSELRRKGVSDEVISEALEGITDDDERVNAKSLVESKVFSTRNLESQKRVNRLVGMLARKGYSIGMAYEVVNEVLSEQNFDEDDDDVTYETNL